MLGFSSPSSVFATRSRFKRNRHSLHENGHSATRTIRTKAQAADNIRNSNVVIVGGGPCGLLAAILLANRNVPVTVLERIKDYSSVIPSRSYALGIGPRGRRTLDTIPGLDDYIAQDGVRRNSLRLEVRNAQGKVTEFQTPPGRDGILIPRFSVAERLREFVDRYDNIKLVQGVSVNNVEFGANGEISLMTNEGVIRSKLVLACDGKNSVVGKYVTNSGEHVECRNGKGVETLTSESTELQIKCVVMKAPLLDEWAEQSDSLYTRSVLLFQGLQKGRSSREQFKASVFHLPPHVRQRIGGHLTSIIRLSNHKVWDLKDVDEAYSFFEANFPQLAIRECISVQSMQEFIDSRPLRFGLVLRRHSLVAHIGSSGGIMFLGDAAHSFPPDVGQGLNAAFEDLHVFMDVLDEAGGDASVGEVLDQYEERRQDDVKGLTKIVRFGNPHVFGHSKIGSFKTFANFALRRRLAKVLPGLLHPPMQDLLDRDLSYGEIATMADQTTSRLYFGGLCLLLLPLFGVMTFRLLP